MEDYVYAYTGYITLTDEAQPISEEWGDNDEAGLAVDVVNPQFHIAPGVAVGVIVAVGDANGADIVLGNRGAQHRVFNAGGNTGIVPVRRLSDVYAKCRAANDTFRISFDVYRKRETDR